MGHIATICFHRYDKLDTNPSNNTGTNFVLQTSLTNESPFALMAFPESLQDPSWYLDSGASNHVTTELGNLSLKGSHLFVKNIVVADGTKISITAVGSGYIQILNEQLFLKDVLVFPLLQKNLFSISKLVHYNPITVEFDELFCYVKERKSKEVCLVGLVNMACII